MALTFENINFNDALFSKLKELCLTASKEMYVRLEIEEKDF